VNGEEQLLSGKVTCVFLNTPTQDDVSISIHFGTGYGNRMVSIENKMNWVGSGSSNIIINIMKNRFKKSLPFIDANFDVTMDTTTLTLKMTALEFKEDIETIVTLLFSKDITKEEFEVQKALSYKQFTSHLENLKFRSLMEIQQYAIPNRTYSVELIKQDLLDVLHEDIILLNKSLFKPSNAYLVICSDNKNELSQVINEENSRIPAEENTAVYHVYKDNLYKDDVITKYHSNKQDSVGTLCFRDKQGSLPLEEEEAYLLIIGDLLFGSEASIHVAKDYSSIIYSGYESIQMKKKLLESVHFTESQFNKTIEGVQLKLRYLVEKKPDVFGKLFGQHAIQNKNLSKLINPPEKVNLTNFLNYINQIASHIKETKIVYLEGEG